MWIAIFKEMKAREDQKVDNVKEQIKNQFEQYGKLDGNLVKRSEYENKLNIKPPVFIAGKICWDLEPNI